MVDLVLDSTRSQINRLKLFPLAVVWGFFLCRYKYCDRKNANQQTVPIYCDKLEGEFNNKL